MPAEEMYERITRADSSALSFIAQVPEGQRQAIYNEYLRHMELSPSVRRQIESFVVEPSSAVTVKR